MPTNSKPKLLLTTLDAVPVTEELLTVIPLPDEIRSWPHVIMCEEDAEAFAKAAGKAAVLPYDEAAPAVEKLGDALQDARALNEALACQFEVSTNPVTRGDPSRAMIAGLDLEKAKSMLEKAGFEVLSYGDLSGDHVGPESEADALERAVAPFKKHYTPEIAAVAEHYLRGATNGIPRELLDAPEGYYKNVAAAVTDALGGVVERWNPLIASRLLDLWVAGRQPEDVRFWLQADSDDAPDLGFLRAAVIARELEARGLHPVLAASAALQCDGQSTRYLGLLMFSRLAVFDDSESRHREVARELAWKMVHWWGGDIPAVARLFERFLTTNSWALGVAALKKMAQTHAEQISAAHLEKAAVDGKVGELLNLGRELTERSPQQHPNGPRAVLEIWLSATPPDVVAVQLEAALDRDADLVDVELVWNYLLTLLEAKGVEAFPESKAKMASNGYSALGGLIKGIGKASAPTKKRITALCESKAASLGGHHAILAKKGVRQKLPPMPYYDADLAGLKAPQAKAWAAARRKSWAAGITLPKGASAKDIAAVTKAMGAPLPDDVHSFYALHDGAGPDECFRSCRLVSLEEALERRTELREIDGAPFDETWLPLTDDGGSNHHCVVMSGKQAGFIVDFDHETGGGRVLAKSFASFVANATWGD